MILLSFFFFFESNILILIQVYIFTIIGDKQTTKTDNRTAGEPDLRSASAKLSCPIHPRVRTFA